MLEQRFKDAVRDVPDFPKEGILFKDITPIFNDPQLCKDITARIVEQVGPLNPQAIACVEARGFFFGPLVAQVLGIPFIPIRKAGKLPYLKESLTYELEYGTATIEMHQDAMEGIDRVLIHDDLLATGGTAAAAAKLIGDKAEVVGFSFLVNLSFLNGIEALKPFSEQVFTVVEY